MNHTPTDLAMSSDPWTSLLWIGILIAVAMGTAWVVLRRK